MAETLDLQLIQSCIDGDRASQKVLYDRLAPRMFPICIRYIGDRTQAEVIVAKLIEEKYVDDLRYASAFARDKASIAGWGEMKIRYMLSAKGISKDVIAEAFAEVDEGKAAYRLEKLMENKARSLKSDAQARLKMLRFGMGRGYQYDEVAEVTDKILGRWKDSES